MPRTGRPIAEDPKAYKISARLTADELKEFEAYARSQGMTNAEVIKRGIRMQIEAMDSVISNLKNGKVSEPVDLSDFKK